MNGMKSGAFSRRAFMGIGAGALVARCLPLMAEQDREIFYAAEPMGEEALGMPIMKDFKPTPLEIRVGAKKAFTCLHISDSHLAQMNSRDLWKADEVELKWYEGRRRHFATNATGLAAALLYAKVKGLPLLHTGDFLDYPSDANVRWGRRELEGFDCIYALGNHELAGTPRPGPKGKDLAAARKLLSPYFPNDLSVYSRVVNEVNFVAFDNVGLSADVFDAQFAAIRKEFAKGLPVVLLYHIPFYTPGLAAEDAKRKGKKVEDLTSGNLACCPGRNDIRINITLQDWLKKQKNLKAMLCGHKHFEFQEPFAEGVVQYVAGATYLRNAYEITFN